MARIPNIKIEIQGIEEVKELIEKHRELLRELEENLNRLYVARLELEVKLNQPSTGTDD